MNDHENSAPRRFDWREFPFMLLPIALLVSIRIKMLPFVGVPNCYNGDAAVANLMTRDLAHGTFTTIFYGQTYPGSIESFFALPFYKWVFGGPDLRGFACGQIVLLSLTLLAVYRIGHSLGGRLGALAGSLTLAIGTMQIFENMAGAHQSYIATMLLGSLLILVGAQLLKQATIRRAMLAGLITGLGMWTNPQILIFLAPILAVLFLRGQLCSLLHRGELGQVAGPRLMRTAKVLFALWLLLFWGILELALLGGFEYRFGDFHLSMTKHPKYMIRLVVLLCAGLGLFEFHLTTHKRRLVTLLA